MEADEWIVSSDGRGWAGRRLVYWLVVFVLALAAVAAMQKQMQVTLLHAETAEYLLVSNCFSVPRQLDFVRNLCATSSHGHYTPLAFTAEFLYAKWAGLRPNWWRNRQLFVGGVLAFCLFGLIRAAVAITGASFRTSNLLAAGSCLLFVAHPLMRELLQWPFHIFQMMWIIVALALAWSIIQLFSSSHPRRVFWIIGALAYGSMHVLGLGVACAAGTLAVLLIIFCGLRAGSLPEFKSHKRTLICAAIFLMLLVSAHGTAMILLNNAHIRASVAHHYDLQRTLGLVAVMPLSIIGILFGVRLEDLGIDHVLRSAAPFGLAFLLAAGFFVVVLARKTGRTRAENAALGLAVFSIVMLVVMVTMIGLREMQEPTASGFYGYLIGARYVMPFAVPWLGLALTVVMLQSPVRLQILALIAGIFGGAAVWGHFSYERHVRPDIQPLHGASNIQVWHDLTELAAEARSANLPIPNLPLQRMTGFPFMDLKYFDLLLRQSLHLSASERTEFIDWNECRDSRFSEYVARCPTLPVVAHLLDLDLSLNDSSQRLDGGVEVKSARLDK